MQQRYPEITDNYIVINGKTIFWEHVIDVYSKCSNIVKYPLLFVKLLSLAGFCVGVVVACLYFDSYQKFNTNPNNLYLILDVLMFFLGLLIVLGSVCGFLYTLWQSRKCYSCFVKTNDGTSHPYHSSDSTEVKRLETQATEKLKNFHDAKSKKAPIYNKIKNINKGNRNSKIYNGDITNSTFDTNNDQSSHKKVEKTYSATKIEIQNITESEKEEKTDMQMLIELLKRIFKKFWAN